MYTLRLYGMAHLKCRSGYRIVEISYWTWSYFLPSHLYKYKYEKSKSGMPFVLDFKMAHLSPPPASVLLPFDQIIVMDIDSPQLKA